MEVRSSFRDDNVELVEGVVWQGAAGCGGLRRGAAGRRHWLCWRCSLRSGHLHSAGRGGHAQ